MPLPLVAVVLAPPVVLLVASAYRSLLEVQAERRGIDRWSLVVRAVHRHIRPSAFDRRACLAYRAFRACLEAAPVVEPSVLEPSVLAPEVRACWRCFLAPDSLELCRTDCPCRYHQPGTIRSDFSQREREQEQALVGEPSGEAWVQVAEPSVLAVPAFPSERAVDRIQPEVHRTQEVRRRKLELAASWAVLVAPSVQAAFRALRPSYPAYLELVAVVPSRAEPPALELVRLD